VTVSTIRNRIKRLKASGVMDVILVMNPYKIGYNTFAIIGTKLETGASFLVSTSTTKQASLFELLFCDFHYPSRNRSGQ
jgi:DNA-binding Lrp family transcriptional regulator